MHWFPIAHKDVNDAGRSRLVWIILGLFVVGFVGFVMSEGLSVDTEVAALVDDLAQAIALVVPVIALLLGYKSIAYERINGSIVLVLSFPHSRADLVAGKYVGRSFVLLVPLLVAMGASGLAMLVLLGATGMAWYLWFVLISILYALVFLSVAMAISMSTAAERRITLGAFAAYILLVSLWDNLVTTFVLVIYRFNFDVLVDLPSWAFLAYLLKPSEAYYRLLHLGFDSEHAMELVQDGVPWFVDWWTAVLVLVAWIGVPMLVGYWRFVRADL